MRSIALVRISTVFLGDKRPAMRISVTPKVSSAPEQAGWVIGTALDVAARQMLVNVFDAHHVDDGPIASARLEYAMPMGLHARFVA